jgi:hypothetical protein
MSFLEFFLMVLACIAALALVRGRLGGEVEMVTSRVDGVAYLVRKLPDSQQAADMLANLSAALDRLIRHLVAKFPDDPRFAALYTAYSSAALSEGSASDGYTSYSVDKTRIVMCLRQTDLSFVPLNTAIYVFVHEAAHLATVNEVGHGPIFWANFKQIVDEAIAIGVYERVDYAAAPERYCGIRISSTVA